jgi:hypothetical protein
MRGPVCNPLIRMARWSHLRGLRSGQPD